MSEAPERIWWNVAPLPYSYTSTVQFAGGVEYVRADRIEELEAKLGRYNDLVADKINLRSENADLKAKLAKAIERFTEISGRPNEMIWAHDSEVREAMRDMEQIADTTIAELTGGKDD